MIEENKGHIITIASAAGMVGVHGLYVVIGSKVLPTKTTKRADYCASKFGAFGFDEAIRVFLRKKVGTW